ncbi:MAG: hypothetical protein GY725_25575 [bacterium]|nr:hypothetical protein [bacterium]
MVLGKLEFDHSSGVQERVSVWINPTNLLGGEAGLGAPQLVIDGYNADSSWRKLLLSAPRGSHIDALRVGDALADVLSGAEGACLIAAGTGVQCQILGGASQPGGVSAEVDATTDGWFGGQLCETDDLALCLIDPSGLTFITPTAPAFFWNLDFSGEFSSIAVTFGYSDEGLMPVQEQLLAIFHFVSPFPGCIPGVNCEWIALPTVRDPIANTLEIVATDLSPHAIGLLPAIPVFPTSD